MVLIYIIAPLSGCVMIATVKGINMIYNVGTADRIIRVILGVALIGATLLGYIGVWGWVGLVAIATGLFRFCPAYLPFGLRACPAPSGKPNP